MRAEEARKKSESSKEFGANYQRNYILTQIEKETKVGNFEYRLIFMDGYKLFEEDYVFFENLGYKVQRPVEKIWKPMNEKSKLEYYMEPGKISW